MEKLLKYKYKGVSEWARRVDLFRFDMLLVLYFIKTKPHWVLIVVDFPTKEIRVYDSLYGEHKEAAEAVMACLKAEAI